MLINKLIFSCDQITTNKILSEIGTEDRQLDFNLLIPQPLTVYMGDIYCREASDFGENTWLKWYKKNWGSKCNAFDVKVVNDTNIQACQIYFQTDGDGDVPYPVIIAFANKYNIEFTYKYFDQGLYFWGVEEWSNGDRISKKINKEDMKLELARELLGIDLQKL